MLKVDNISKNFNGLEVLQNISFTIENDEIVAMIGPSGCGKSTLLKIISGLCPQDRGHVHTDISDIGFVFQDDRILPWRTIYENIQLVQEEEKRDHILSLIEEVGLKGFENYYPKQLSGGMLKRCGIARAFYSQGQLLLMDEPFQSLDYCLRHDMMKMLLKVWRNHRQSVLFITHEIDEALTVAHRVLVLSKRPTSIIRTFDLPGDPGRDPSTIDLINIRQEIISLITENN